MQSFDSRKDIKKMIRKYLAGTATPEEKAFVEAYDDYLEKADELELPEQEIESLRHQTYYKISSKLMEGASAQTRSIKLYRYTAAAAILLLASVGTYFYINNSDKKASQTISKIHDVAPGTNKAQLTLANGKRITLDNRTDSKILAAAGLSVATNVKGELIYSAANNNRLTEQNGTNTVATPRGGQYQVVLADGTHVWLNAASSLTFPVAFKGKSREVTLTGEGYFEVKKNHSVPFYVHTSGQDVEVTGTHFNINAYHESGPMATTLLEGSVTVHYNGQQQKIKPGQQALVETGSTNIPVEAADTEAATAWKNGLFEFNNASLSNIMNQLERWYDIKVDYSNLPAKRYNGTIPRTAKLSEVLKMLEVTGNIRFRINADRTVSIKK